MELTLYQIDAFASRVFAGNPAGVCPLDAWLPDATMQAIAAENNVAETAFFVPQGEGYALRWFTPAVEVDLCGHATLASGFVVAAFLKPGASAMHFETRSGTLAVARDGDLYTLDFPALPGQPVAEAESAAVTAALGRPPGLVLGAADYMAVFAAEDEVRALAPDMARLAALGRRGVIATAPGRGCDFVSRFFAPAFGIPEDPVTGSAHCTLTPYWAARLGKRRLAARQISTRGGELACEDRGARVGIAGRCALYLEGRIHV